MTTTDPPSGGHFVVPTWWTEPAFNLTEVAKFIDTPISTVSLWVTFARAGGHVVGDTSARHALYSCHDVFALAMLAKLRSRSIPITASLVADAFAFTAEHGRPRPVQYNGEWVVFDDGASLTVPAWLCWTAVRAWASKFFGTSHV